MSLYDEARTMADKDFKVRFKGASYNATNKEMADFRNWRYNYWVNRIKQERGIK
jgi:hypothetical protein